MIFATNDDDVIPSYYHMTLLDKYQQVKLLIPQGNQFVLTNPPSFGEIETKLFGSLTHGYHSHFDVNGQLVETCFTMPIIHRGCSPTLKEVLEQMPYYPEYKEVYVYLTKISIEPINGVSISRLKYTVTHGQQVDIREYHLPFEDLDQDLHSRYDSIIPIKFEKDYPFPNCRVMHTQKPPFEKIGNVAYTWDSFDPNQAVATHQQDSKNLMGPDNQLYARFAMEIPTFHRWAYYGFFKPDLKEVMLQLPSSVFENQQRILVTTELPSYNPADVIVGDYHLGVTSVWILQQPVPLPQQPQPQPAPLPPQQRPTSPPQPQPQPTSPQQPQAQYNEEYCMICLTAEPNTMVLPCYHVVVCDRCSVKLQNTNDAHVCVKCRRPIHQVLYP
jgi:hypothetical protein